MWIVNSKNYEIKHTQAPLLLTKVYILNITVIILRIKLVITFGNVTLVL